MAQRARHWLTVPLCKTCRNSAGHLKAKYLRTCPHCGVEFVGDDAKAKFCSRPCQQQGQARRRVQ